MSVRDTCTPGMQARGLRTTIEERTWVEACLRPNGYPPEVLTAMVAHRMAQHEVRCAWADVEYAARRAGNCVGMIHPSIRPTEMRRLTVAAYDAEEAEHTAAVAMRTAETSAERARFEERVPWPT